MQACAREAGAVRVGMPTPEDSPGDRLLEALGYRVRWKSWILALPEGRSIEAQPLPDGHTIRSATDAGHLTVWTVIEDAFLEWSERDRQTFADFAAQVMRRPGFEPWNLRVVTDPADEIVGAAFVVLSGDVGFVERLAVRRDRRSQGLARALLADAFTESRAHGATRSELSTDSRTGAPRPLREGGHGRSPRSGCTVPSSSEPPRPAPPALTSASGMPKVDQDGLERHHRRMATSLPAGWYVDPADGTRYRFWSGTQWTTHVQNRGEVDIAAAEAEVDAASRPLPDFDAVEGDDRDPSTGRRLPSLPVVLAVVVLAAIVASAGVAAFRPAEGGQTLTGEVRVAAGALRGGDGQDGGFEGDGTRCGTGAAPGVGAGSEVTVSNGRGRVLGHTELQSGHLDRTLTSTACVFHYEVTGVDDAEVYLLRVAERPPTRMTRAELEASGGRLDLRVG